jgi:uncharacterized protein (TIGR01777 family)
MRPGPSHRLSVFDFVFWNTNNFPVSRKRIVIAGGRGFIGTALAGNFSARQYAVVLLTRSPHERADGIGEAAWDGKNPGDWVHFLDGAEAIINLAGKSINGPPTPENLRALTASRVDSVQAIAAAITQIQAPPRVWVQAGATGFYGDMKAVPCNESAPNGADSLAQICRDWESAFAAAPVPGTRKVTLRMGLVLGWNGGALPVLGRLAKLFLGGTAGDGRQFVSWIHLADLARMYAVAVENEQLSGPCNAVAPGAVTNAEFMRELRRARHRPWSPPVPEWAVKLGARLIGFSPALVLGGQRCPPEKFLAAGFEYQFPQLRPALEDLCRR